MPTMDVIYTMDIGLLRMYAMAIPVLFSYGDIGVNVLWIYHHCSLGNIWTNSPYCPVLRDCLLLCLPEPWSLC